MSFVFLLAFLNKKYNAANVRESFGAGVLD
jgi:hypothetical protein